MEIRYSAHGAYHRQYHIVWIPKYRKAILKDEVKQYVEQHLKDICGYHPEIVIEKQSVQKDYVPLVIIIPPKFKVSEVVGKIKANTGREILKQFAWIEKIYWRNEFWSLGFFSSTIGINEKVIKRYVEFQEKVDKGAVQLSFGF